MSGFEIFGLVILGFIMLSVVGIYRLATHPRGIWRESWKYQAAYLDYCRRYRKHDYRWGYVEHQKAMIMWFRAPLVEEFLARARALRDYLVVQDRKPQEALSIWGTLMKEDPLTAAGTHATPATMVLAYDRLVAADEAVEAIQALSGMKAHDVCDEEKWH